KLHGMTANSFSSVSLTPPLVLWSASLYAQSLPAFQEGGHFVVNILSYDQIELSNKFAKSTDDKFVDVDHIIPDSGAPVLIGAAAEGAASDRPGLFPRQPQPKNRRDPHGSVGQRALRHRQAQHEVGRVWRAGRMASGLGVLSAYQRRSGRGRHHARRRRQRER